MGVVDIEWLLGRNWWNYSYLHCHFRIDCAICTDIVVGKCGRNAKTRENKRMAKKKYVVGVVEMKDGKPVIAGGKPLGKSTFREPEYAEYAMTTLAVQAHKPVNDLGIFTDAGEFVS